MDGRQLWRGLQFFPRNHAITHCRTIGTNEQPASHAEGFSPFLDRSSVGRTDVAVTELYVPGPEQDHGEEEAKAQLRLIDLSFGPDHLTSRNSVQIEISEEELTMSFLAAPRASPVDPTRKSDDLTPGTCPAHAGQGQRCITLAI